MDEYNLVYHKGHWKLMDQAGKVIEIYANRPKSDAINFASKRLKDTPCTLTIYQMNGNISEMLSFPRSDPSESDAKRRNHAVHPLGLWP